MAFAGREDGSAKCEAVDFAFHSDFSPGSPDFRDVERDADNDPAEARVQAFEDGFKAFHDRFGIFLHCGVLAGREIQETKEGTPERALCVQRPSVSRTKVISRSCPRLRLRYCKRRRRSAAW